MNAQPRVTAVIIFLNEEKFLQESIESVFSQDFEEWELILVDDGSTDASSGIARQYAEQHPSRVRYIEHAGHQNRGMSASRNVGVQNARGDYVAFLDADDIWLPHKLEHEVHILDAHPEAAMVYGPIEYWFSWTQDPDDSERDRAQYLAVPHDRMFGPPELFIKCFPFGEAADPTMCSFLIRREVVGEVGWFEETFRDFYEDLAFLFKVLLKKTVWVSGTCVARYRMHPDSYIHRAVKAGKFRLAMLKLLNFLQEHLRREGVQDPEIWESFRRARWPHDHPRLQRLAGLSREFAKAAQNLPDGFRLFVSRLKSATLGNSRRYFLAQAASGAPEEIRVEPTGGTIRIVPGTMDGSVDVVQRHAWLWHTFALSGWAFDGSHRQPAGQVAVFVDGEADHCRHTVVSRSDLVEGFKVPSLERAGFRVSLPSHIFERDPPPEVRVFAVSSKGVASELRYRPEYDDGSRKRRLGNKTAQNIKYSLAEGAGIARGSQFIVSRTGKEIRIVPGALDGSVDLVRERGRNTRFSGWASDGSHSHPADQVVVFVGGEADHDRHTVVSRSDLVEGFKAPSLEQAGFDVILPGPIFDRDPPPVVRVFAISSIGVVSELRYRAEYRNGSRTVRLGNR